MVKQLPAMWETWVQSLGQEDLEKEMATHSSILAWKIPWTEEPARLQSMESQRVGLNWGTSLSLLSLAQPSASLWSSLRLEWMSLLWLWEVSRRLGTARKHGRPAFLKPFLFRLSATLNLIWIKEQEVEYKQTENKVCGTGIKIHLLEWC